MKNLVLFLSAGYDTISNTLTSILYFLYKYPAERNKLKEEILNVIGNDLNNIT